MLKVLRYFFNNPLMVAIHLYIYILDAIVT